MTPANYREVVKGSPFDPASRGPQSGYQRQTARDVWIEKKISKLKLFPG